MFEQTNGINAGQNAGSGEMSATSHQVDYTPQNGGQRMYTQAEVNEMAKNMKRSAYEQAARVRDEQPVYFDQKYGQNMQQNMQQQYADSLNDMKRQIKEDLVREQQIQQNEYCRVQNQQKIEKTVQTWKEKKDIGTKKYQDFGEVVKENEMAAFPNVFYAVMENIDNAEDVLYELAKNPRDLMLLEAQRKQEVENMKNGIESNMSIKMLQQMSKAAKDKHASENMNDTSYKVNNGLPGSRTTVNQDYLKNETNRYMDNLTSSTVLSVDRQGAKHVQDFEKMFKGQF